jgi:hypothetical protein
MNTRSKNLALAGGAAALLGIIGVNVLVGPAAAPGPAVAPAPSVVASGPAQTPAVVPSPGLSPGGSAVSSDPVSAARRSYAIGMNELRGLPPDAEAGTAFELWVTWEPPVTQEVRLDRLIGDVVLERVIPGSVPEAPVTALLSVPAERTGDLIYADTFGSLNVVLPE